MSASFIRTVVRLVCGCLGIVLILAATLDYWVVATRVRDVADARLAQSARIINRLVDLTPNDQMLRMPPDALLTGSDARRLLPRSSDLQIGFEIWSKANVLIASSDVIRGMALDAAPPGFADISIKDHRWRIFTLLGDEGRWVRVGESYENRNEIDHVLLFLGLSSLLIVLALAFLMRDVVWTSAYPLRRLGEQLTARYQR
jgi:hypothetical protein